MEGQCGKVEASHLTGRIPFCHIWRSFPGRNNIHPVFIESGITLDFVAPFSAKTTLTLFMLYGFMHNDIKQKEFNPKHGHSKKKNIQKQSWAVCICGAQQACTIYLVTKLVWWCVHICVMYNVHVLTRNYSIDFCFCNFKSVEQFWNTSLTFHLYQSYYFIPIWMTTKLISSWLWNTQLITVYLINESSEILDTESEFEVSYCNCMLCAVLHAFHLVRLHEYFPVYYRDNFSSFAFV